MKNEKETKANLLASAKKEFMEKGYTQASLRNICKNAGVTTGALYFFFRDKEALFASLVEEPLHGLFEIMQSHYRLELQVSADNPINLRSREAIDGDLEVCVQVVHFMYRYYDEFLLLLTKSQGSGYERCIEQFVTISEKHYRMLSDCCSSQYHTKPVEEYMIHWMSHMQVDVFVHLITHQSEEEEACRHIKEIVKRMRLGWVDLFIPQ